MRPFQLPVFDQIDLDDLDEYYKGTVELAGKTVDIDLNFDETSIEDTVAGTINQMLSTLPDLREATYRTVAEHYEAGSEAVKNYFSDLLGAGTTEEKKAAMLNGADKSLSEEQQLLSNLYLKRVGFYPDDAENFVIFDYTIGDEYSHDLLVVVLNAQSAVAEVTLETRHYNID